MRCFFYHWVRFGLVCAAIVASPTLSARAAVDETVRLRFTNHRISEVLEWTSVRSPAFRRLVASIESSDLIVYLVEGRCVETGARSCLRLVSPAGGRRLIIRLNPRQPLASVIGQLAHELQHAAEIAGDHSVLDDDSLRQLYARIGFMNCPRGGPECWETSAASTTESAVLKEAFASRADPAPAPDAAYFGTWSLNVERSTFNGAPPPRASTRIVGDRRFGLISTVIHTIDLDGGIEDRSYVSRLDGRPYIVSAPGDRPTVTIAETVLDRCTTRFVVAQGNELIATGIRTISDGREMTIETHTVDAYGREMVFVTVWEKLSAALGSGALARLGPKAVERPLAAV